jgi:hypothetical protein
MRKGHGDSCVVAKAIPGLTGRHNHHHAMDQFCFIKILTCCIVANSDYNHRRKSPSKWCQRQHETEIFSENEQNNSSDAPEGKNELDSSLQNSVKE